jgi:hypothetical protein
MSRIALAFLLACTSAASSFAIDQNRSAHTASAAARALFQESGFAVPPEGDLKCGLPAIALASRHPAGSRASVLFRTLMVRPEMQMSIAGDGFRVHFDTAGTHAATMLDAGHNRIPGSARQYADSVLAILRYVRPFEVESLGYSPPPADGVAGGGPEYDVYVMELGNLYGYTTPDELGEEGYRSPTFITVDNDFIFVTPPANRGLPALRVTLAHEFHHAIQIGAYGYWTSEIFFYEITSTWMEDVVYTDVNDYLNYLRAQWSHFRNPDQAFDANEIIMYSRGIWGQFVEKRYGRDAMKRCWEEIRSAHPLAAIDRALQRSGSSFATAYGEWSMWNYYTGARADSVRYYPEAATYPPVLTQAYAFPGTDAERVIAGSLHNLGTRYHEVLRGTDTLMLALVHVDQAAAQGGTVPATAYTYRVNVTRPDESYRPTSGPLFVKTEVPDPVHWGTRYVYNGKGGTIDVGGVAEGKPFPQPFRAGGTGSVFIPVSAALPLTGTLHVFSSSMDRIVEQAARTQIVGTLACVVWNGLCDNGTPAPTGVYVFFLELPGRTLSGKIAVIGK